jgi:hypothetical protein
MKVVIVLDHFEELQRFSTGACIHHKKCLKRLVQTIMQLL